MLTWMMWMAVETGLAPSEMIGLLASGADHEFADFRVPGEQRLGVIQGLRGHLAGMVHAHQGGGFPPFVGRQGGIGIAGLAGPGRRGRAGDGPAGRRGRKQGPQRAVGC
jgi:hypothetical protein